MHYSFYIPQKMFAFYSTRAQRVVFLLTWPISEEQHSSLYSHYHMYTISCLVFFLCLNVFCLLQWPSEPYLWPMLLYIWLHLIECVRMYILPLCATLRHSSCALILASAPLKRRLRSVLENLVPYISPSLPSLSRCLSLGLVKGVLSSFTSPNANIEYLHSLSIEFCWYNL